MVCHHHYLANANLVGEQLRYVVTFRGQWLVLLGWSAASFHLKDREGWLRWSDLQRRTRFHLLAQNSRLVILPDRSYWPNLASRALALVCQRLSQDWQQTYGHPIAAVESFVDSQLFRGTAYKANQWTLLGKTDGFKRVAEDFYVQHDRPKQLWVKSLEAEQLGAEAFLGHNRQYWGIENGAHQRLDCSAMQDRLRVRDPDAATVLGLFHRMSLTLFMAWAKTQPNQRDRTYPTWQARPDGNRWGIIRQVTQAPG